MPAPLKAGSLRLGAGSGDILWDTFVGPSDFPTWMPYAALQEDSYFAGRIVCEVEGGQLNDTAVMLEGDTGLSEGARVHLNLSQLPAFRLFPGQVSRGRPKRTALVDSSKAICGVPTLKGLLSGTGIDGWLEGDFDRLHT
jgi:hypothetical protein